MDVDVHLKSYVNDVIDEFDQKIAIALDTSALPLRGNSYGNNKD